MCENQFREILTDINFHEKYLPLAASSAESGGFGLTSLIFSSNSISRKLTLKNLSTLVYIFFSGSVYIIHATVVIVQTHEITF